MLTPGQPRVHAVRTAGVVATLTLALLGFGPTAYASPGAELASAPSRNTSDHGASSLRTSAVDAIDTSDRTAVATAYRERYLPALAVPAPAADPADVAACRAGSTPSDLQAATLQAINYVRAMSQVPPVTFDSALSAKAQQAALMMYANDQLDHAPPSSWACYSADGAEAAGRSNIALGYSGASVVRGYMNDPGAGNIEAGHRWWLQRPSAQQMGNGIFGDANALWVVGDEESARTPTFTSWPTAGFFPAPLEPNGRWSLTASDPSYDLSEATVSIVDGAGQAVTATAYPVGAFGSLVFEVPTLPKPTGTETDDYVVTVGGIRVGTETIAPYSYTVSLIDPTPVPTPVLTAITKPTIAGTPQLDSTLTAGAPTWSETGVSTTYQWLRSGKAITGATKNKLKLSATDLGTKISVVASGNKVGFDPVVSTSDSTLAVTRIPAVLSLKGSSSAVGKIKLVVTVSAPGETVPTGTVSVKEGGKTLNGKLKLTKGIATYEASKVKSGAHTYEVAYAGSSRLAPVTKSVTTTVRAKVDPALTVTGSSPSPGKIKVSVGVTASGQSSLGGTVTIKEGSKTIKSGLKVSKGKASYSGSAKPGKHTYTVRYSGTSEVNAGSGSVKITVKAPVVLKSYESCAAMRDDYPHGVGKTNAEDSTSGDPVTNFFRHNALYSYNDGASRHPGEKDLDRDNDGIACESN
ncbi:MAG TPA: Ig-like domain repeat protein [Propionibacteriaceae bacterium]